MQVPKGGLVAIVGKSGSGKSSLLHALLNQMTGHGTVSLQAPVGYVPQISWCFEGTVQENIMDGLPLDEALLEQVWGVSGLSTDKVSLQTRLGENGTGLSGGQKKRVNIARALFRRPQVLLMDDPFSSLDPRSTALLFRHLRLMGCTRVIVTHQLSLLVHFDNILVMEEGRITRQGDYSSLSDLPLLQAQSSPLPNIDIDASEPAQPQGQQQMVMDEMRHKGGLKWSLYGQYIRDMGVGWFILGCVTCLMGELCAYSTNLWVSYWIDHPSIPVSQFQNIYFLISAVSSLLNASKVLIFALVHIAIGRRLHNTVLSQLLGASFPNFLERVPHGRILNRLSKDLNIVGYTLFMSFELWVSVIFRALLDIVLTVLFTTPYTLIPMTLVLLLCVYVTYYYLYTYREINRLEYMSRSIVCQRLIQYQYGLSVTSAHDNHQHAREQFLCALLQNRRNKVLVIGMEQWLNIRINFIASLVTLLANGYAVVYPSQSASEISLLIMYSSTFCSNLYFVLTTLGSFNTSFIPYERLVQYSTLPQERQDGLPLTTPSPQHPLLHFQQVTASYRPDLPIVLHKLTFSITKGQKIGVVGKSGSGKSSLFNIMMGILSPSQGQVMLQGVDIQQMSLSCLRQHFSYISQDPFIFEGTLAQNLDPCGRMKQEEIGDALVSLGCGHVLEMGLDSKMDEISSGEQQLVSVLRAVLDPRQILLVDEATACLDGPTERLVQGLLFRGDTIICIAHRVTTLSSFDKIMVLHQATIVEYDSPQELAQQEHSYFNTITNHQLRI